MAVSTECHLRGPEPHCQHERWGGLSISFIMTVKGISQNTKIFPNNSPASNSPMGAGKAVFQALYFVNIGERRWRMPMRSNRRQGKKQSV